MDNEQWEQNFTSTTLKFNSAAGHDRGFASQEENQCPWAVPSHQGSKLEQQRDLDPPLSTVYGYRGA